jgi:hypothetical protein
MNDGYHSTAILAANSELLRTLISAIVVLDIIPAERMNAIFRRAESRLNSGEYGALAEEATAYLRSVRENMLPPHDIAEA